MGPYGAKFFKMLLLSQIAGESFPTSDFFFFPNGPHKVYVWDFEILKFEFLMIFIVHENELEHKFQTVIPPTKSHQKVKLFLNFTPNGPHKTTLGFFEILSFLFLTIFFF